MEKIQELTEKLFHEGVEKGQAEAARLVEEGQQKAAQIIEDAKKKAQEIEAQASRDAANLQNNTKNELKLYTGQALSALKSEIANVLTNKVVKNAVEGLTADKDFLGKFAVAMASKWVENEPVTISTADAESLKAYFAAQAKDLLDKGVKIESVNGKATLFSIAPADGSYKIDFGKEEFENYFRNFLRPQLIEMLF